MGWVVSFTPRLLHPWRNNPLYSLNKRLGGGFKEQINILPLAGFEPRFLARSARSRVHMWPHHGYSTFVIEEASAKFDLHTGNMELSTPSFVLSLFAYQFTPTLHLHSLIFCLTLFGWLRSITFTLTPTSEGNTIFCLLQLFQEGKIVLGKDWLGMTIIGKEKKKERMWCRYI